MYMQTYKFWWVKASFNYYQVKDFSNLQICITIHYLENCKTYRKIILDIFSKNSVWNAFCFDKYLIFILEIHLEMRIGGEGWGDLMGAVQGCKGAYKCTNNVLIIHCCYCVTAVYITFPQYVLGNRCSKRFTADCKVLITLIPSGM
jgi:hypothetical protein